jgi:hypothetical protein
MEFQSPDPRKFFHKFRHFCLYLKVSLPVTEANDWQKIRPLFVGYDPQVVLVTWGSETCHKNSSKNVTRGSTENGASVVSRRLGSTYVPKVAIAYKIYLR